jgi:hypothetical protein
LHLEKCDQHVADVRGCIPQREAGHADDRLTLMITHPAAKEKGGSDADDRLGLRTTWTAAKEAVMRTTGWA